MLKPRVDVPMYVGLVGDGHEEVEAVRGRRCHKDSQDGFSLIEVLVALFMVALVSLATGSFFVGAVGRTAESSRQENALAVATAALERVQSVPVDALLTGRTAAAVSTLVTDPVVAPLLAQDVVTDGNYDPAATGAVVPVVPVVSDPPVLQGTTYTVRTAINRCWLSPTGQQCTRTRPSDGVSVFRATVVVSWGSCGSRCRYSTSALLDAQDDPLFSTPQPLITSATPTTATVGQATALTILGRNLAENSTLSTTAAGGGTFSAVTRVGTDGRRSTATWSGAAPGRYTLAWRNPDGGYAEFSPLTVLPLARPDCAVLSGSSAYVDVSVLNNDLPVSGSAVTVTQQATGGLAEVNGPAIRYTPQNRSASGVFSVRYTLTNNGQTSAEATVTIRVRTSGSCPAP